MLATKMLPSPPRVFIVEDSEVYAEILRGILINSGYVISGIAQSAEEAFEAIINNETEHPLFELILLDMCLPGMDGVELCQILKADNRYKHIPSIMVTANDEDLELHRAYKAGVVDFIRKPIKAIELLARVKSAVKSWMIADQLRNLAFYDSLTGLANRQLLMDRLDNVINLGKRSDINIELLFIDLNYFKLLNDTLGHNAGDLALREVAMRLESCVRESDTVARLGGDEFVVLLSNPGDKEGASHRVCELIEESFSEPLNISGERWQLGVSIGVATFPEMASNAQELLKVADNAMYSEKQRSRCRADGDIYSPQV